MTIPKARIIIAMIYIYSLAWACFPFFGWGGYDVEPFGLSCTLAWGKPDQGNPQKKRNMATVNACFEYF